MLLLGCSCESCTEESDSETDSEDRFESNGCEICKNVLHYLWRYMYLFLLISICVGTIQNRAHIVIESSDPDYVDNFWMIVYVSNL